MPISDELVLRTHYLMLQNGPESEPLVMPTPFNEQQTGTTLADEIWTPLWLGVALLLLGSGLLSTLLGARAGIEGFTTATVGIIMSAYFLGYPSQTLEALYRH